MTHFIGLHFTSLKRSEMESENGTGLSPPKCLTPLHFLPSLSLQREWRRCPKSWDSKRVSWSRASSPVYGRRQGKGGGQRCLGWRLCSRWQLGRCNRERRGWSWKREQRGCGETTGEGGDDAQNVMGGISTTPSLLLRLLALLSAPSLGTHTRSSKVLLRWVWNGPYELE